MKTNRRIFVAAAFAATVSALLPTVAMAGEYLGSYVARLSDTDHYASDGYPLTSAAAIVRQDRANFHRFGRVDRGDEYDPWFRSNESRARLQSMLERPGAIDGATRRAIVNGEPLIEVEVYRSSVRVRILRY